MPLSEHELIICRKWLARHNPGIDWRTGYLQVTRADGTHVAIRPRCAPFSKKVHFRTISIKTLKKIVRKRKAELFAVRVFDRTSGMKIAEPFLDLVSEYEGIFRDELPDGLPPKRRVEFEINLKNDEPPPVRPVIRLS